jgi:hypothetical protein
MIGHLALLATLVAGQPEPKTEEALEAIQELYQYSTQAVQVEPAEVRRLVEVVRDRLEEPTGEAAELLELITTEAQQQQPDGREIRVHASNLYRIVERQVA